ncbi:MAG: hypothetical protein AABZ77_05255 [Chloroflexota bacterium]
MYENIRIYLASSWKNEKTVLQVAKDMRTAGLDVDCFAERNHGEYIANPEDDGIASLKSDYSKRVYNAAKQHMDWANCCVLLNPAGVTPISKLGT